MSAAIDEDRARGPRLGLAVGFAERPPGGGGAADLRRRLLFTLGALILWVMVRILDWIRSALHSLPERG